MKFLNSLITLLAASATSVSAYSLPLEKRDPVTENTLSSRITMGTTQTPSNITNECKNLIEEYYACMPCARDKMNNYDSCCSIFDTDNCKKLISNSLTENSVCQNAEKSSEIGLLNSYISLVSAVCIKDENNNYCPLSKAIQENKDITKEVLSKNTKSQTCLTKTLNSVEAININQITYNNNIQINSIGNTNQSEFKNYGEMMSFLNELRVDEDSAKSSSVQSSSGSSLKIGSSLLFTIALFFSFF